MVVNVVVMVQYLHVVQHHLANLLHTYILLRWPSQIIRKLIKNTWRKKTFRTVVIYFAIKNKYVFFSNMRSLYTLLCVASHSVLCGQKFTQDFSFRIHLFLQNVLQNLVLSTSKSITCGCFYFIFKEFSYSCLSLGDNFAICSGFIGIYCGINIVAQ
jgi:hypothetical protein